MTSKLTDDIRGRLPRLPVPSSLVPGVTLILLRRNAVSEGPGTPINNNTSHDSVRNDSSPAYNNVRESQPCSPPPLTNAAAVVRLADVDVDFVLDLDVNVDVDVDADAPGPTT